VLGAANMTATANLIQHSFELAADRCEDLTPLVYRRLFRQHPEAEPMFRRETDNLVKGSMLALTIDAMLDFAGERTGKCRMVSCEAQSHRRLRHASRAVRSIFSSDRRYDARNSPNRLDARN
jgi:hemoglobin-like flavoprotein